MLDPRDEAFLAHAVRRGRIEQRRAGELAARYQGRPGQLPDALIQLGVLSAAARDQLLAELAHATLPSGRMPRATAPSGGIPPTRADPSGATPGTGASSERTRRSSGRILGQPDISGYAIESVLGRGGMGAVYLATQEASGRKVALKVLLNAGERQIARFERETSALARLDHPGIVALLDSGTQSGQPFLIMEFHECGDLQQALDEGRLVQRQILEICARIARALAHAHEQGILHRDLKPANVLLDDEGLPRLTDFGLAKIVDRETQLTRTNAALGTPHFMAPEQVRGANYTPAVDSYGLGMILYASVTGELPFAGDRLELFARILKQEPQPPWELVQVDREVGKLILWALEKEPEDRPSCSVIAESLERHLAGESMEAEPPSLRRARIRRAGIAIVALIVMVVVGATASQWVDQRQSADEEDRARATIETLNEAARAARRARGGRGVQALERELDGHLAVEDALAKVPKAYRAEAIEQVLASRKRHQEALKTAIPLLVEAGRVEDAAVLARRRVALAPGTSAQIALALVLSRRAQTATEAFVIAKAQMSRSLTPAARSQLAEAFLGLWRPRLACELLKDAGPSALRARALEIAGDSKAALRDAREVERGSPRSLRAAVTRLRLEVVTGSDPALALEALDELKGGAIPEWHEALRLQATTTAREDPTLELRARLLARAVGLASSNLAARLDLAIATDDVPGVSSVIAEFPGLTIARNGRLRIRASRRRKLKEVPPQEEFLRDVRALAGGPRLKVSTRASLAMAVWRGGRDIEGAWEILTPALRLPSRDRSAYDLAAKLATQGGDLERAEAYRRVVAEIDETRRRYSELYRVANYREDHKDLPKALAALRRLARDLPLDSNYWHYLAQAQLGQAAFGRANVTGGEYLLIKRGLNPDGLTMWIHGFGWQEDLRQDVVDELTAPRIEADPRDAVPWLARAMFLAARYNLARPQDREDLEHAADLTLYAAHLAPRSPGALAFAANLLVTAGEGQEGLALAALAEAIDPGCQFATFQIARHAAAQGDARRTIEIVSKLRRLNQPKFTRQLRQDPIFEPILSDADYQDFLRSLPK